VLLQQECTDPIHENALLDLLEGVIGAGRIFLSVTYLLSDRPEPELVMEVIGSSLLEEGTSCTAVIC
jgi:hypothetical protein